jgi:DeoR/GlpR family transcriptional regulator of sugar metabolism
MVDISPGVAAQRDARAQRLQRLRRAIAENGALHLKDAAQLLNVSEMTVRRDLDALARRGLLAKVHGGATSVDRRSADEPGFERDVPAAASRRRRRKR